MNQTNPPKKQDRAEDLIDNWRKYGYVMFPQQRRIYEQLALKVRDKTVIEFGCGAGVGTALLSQYATSVWGTDLSLINAKFAANLYPWINFSVFDLSNNKLPIELRDGPWGQSSAQVSVAIEVIEHVADPITALKNIIAAASEEVWISTPNGTGKKRPPENPYHVQEYTPAEVSDMTRGLCKSIEILSWDTLQHQLLDTTVDPLVYRIRL